MTHPAKIPHNRFIKDFVEKYERAGVGRRQIFNALQVQEFQDIPKSYTTFLKLYKEDLDSVHADTVAEIGSKVVEQAKNGDFKSQEFYLSTKGGWNKTNVEVSIETEADSSAIDKLKELLSRQ